MPQEINQLMQGQENPDETAAALAFATKLSEGLLPKAPKTQEMGATSVQNQGGGQIIAQQEKTQPEANNQDVEKMVDSKLADFKKEIESEKKEDKTEKNDLDDFKKSIEKTIKDKFDTLTKSIKDALKE